MLSSTAAEEWVEGEYAKLLALLPDPSSAQPIVEYAAYKRKAEEEANFRQWVLYINPLDDFDNKGQRDSDTHCVLAIEDARTTEAELGRREGEKKERRAKEQPGKQAEKHVSSITHIGPGHIPIVNFPAMQENTSDLAKKEKRARQDAEERARKDAEEQARKEAEEQARKEAEEQARREKEEQARREAGKEGDQWQPGTVKKRNLDGTFDIEYADGTIDANVSQEWIRLPATVATATGVAASHGAKMVTTTAADGTVMATTTKADGSSTTVVTNHDAATTTTTTTAVSRNGAVSTTRKGAGGTTTVSANGKTITMVAVDGDRTTTAKVNANGSVTVTAIEDTATINAMCNDVAAAGDPTNSADADTTANIETATINAATNDDGSTTATLADGTKITVSGDGNMITTTAVDGTEMMTTTTADGSSTTVRNPNSMATTTTAVDSNGVVSTTAKAGAEGAAMTMNATGETITVVAAGGDATATTLNANGSATLTGADADTTASTNAVTNDDGSTTVTLADGTKITTQSEDGETLLLGVGTKVDTKRGEVERARKEAEEQARKEAEKRARQEADEAKETTTPEDDDHTQEAEEKARKEAEQRARQEAEEQASKAAEEQARKAAEEKARKEAEEEARREAEEQARKEAEEQARREAEEQASKAAEEQARKAGEEQARKEAEEQARREAEEQAKKEAEEQARKEAEEQARKEAEEQARKEAEEQARKEAEEQARKEAEERAMVKGGEQGEPGERARNEVEEKKMLGMNAFQSQTSVGRLAVFARIMLSKTFRSHMVTKRKRFMQQKRDAVKRLKQLGRGVTGNLVFYTDNSQTHRQALRWHPHIQAWLEVWYECITKRFDSDGDRTLDFPEYKEFHRLLLNHYADKDDANGIITDETRQRWLLEDWERDSHGDGTLSKEEMKSAVFEVVDMFCETDGLPEYVAWLESECTVLFGFTQPPVVRVTDAQMAATTPRAANADTENKGLEEEEQARNKAEEQARREKEKRAIKEAEERAIQEAEERAMKEAEEQAKQNRSQEAFTAEELAREEAEKQAKKAAEEKARKEAEERTKREAEEWAKKKAADALAAEERAKWEAEERAKRDAEKEAREASAEQPTTPLPQTRVLTPPPSSSGPPAAPAPPINQPRQPKVRIAVVTDSASMRHLPCQIQDPTKLIETEVSSKKVLEDYLKRSIANFACSVVIQTAIRCRLARKAVANRKMRERQEAKAPSPPPAIKEQAVAAATGPPYIVDPFVIKGRGIAKPGGTAITTPAKSTALAKTAVVVIPSAVDPKEIVLVAKSAAVGGDAGAAAVRIASAVTFAPAAPTEVRAEDASGEIPSESAFCVPTQTVRPNARPEVRPISTFGMQMEKRRQEQIDALLAPHPPQSKREPNKTRKRQRVKKQEQPPPHPLPPNNRTGFLTPTGTSLALINARTLPPVQPDCATNKTGTQRFTSLTPPPCPPLPPGFAPLPLAPTDSDEFRKPTQTQLLAETQCSHARPALADATAPHGRRCSICEDCGGSGICEHAASRVHVGGQAGGRVGHTAGTLAGMDCARPLGTLAVQKGTELGDIRKAPPQRQQHHPMTSSSELSQHAPPGPAELLEQSKLPKGLQSRLGFNPAMDSVPWSGESEWLEKRTTAIEAGGSTAIEACGRALQPARKDIEFGGTTHITNPAAKKTLAKRQAPGVASLATVAVSSPPDTGDLATARTEPTSRTYFGGDAPLNSVPLVHPCPPLSRKPQQHNRQQSQQQQQQQQRGRCVVRHKVVGVGGENTTSLAVGRIEKPKPPQQKRPNRMQKWEHSAAPISRRRHSHGIRTKKGGRA
jgi:hypothetical protein